MKKLILLSLFIYFTCTLSTSAQCKRGLVVSNYNNVYLNTVVSTTDLAWTGSASTCTYGTISDTAQARSLRRINYFRDLVGLPSNITFDTTWSRMCQEAALMFTANSALSHSPPTSWVCYTIDGADAAGSSNISLGSYASSAISAFMNDNGAGNTAVGHRRWILYSRGLKFGMGSTSNASALWVFGPQAPAPTIDYITYPTKGFFPAPLVPSSGRWSFGIPGADFDNATVTVTDDAGVSLTVALEPVDDGYGDNTIVFKPSGINTTGPFDEKYTIQISNVMIGSTPQTFTYDVIVVQPVHPPTCPTGLAWSEPDCMCLANPGVPEISATNGMSVLSNPFMENLVVKMKTDKIREIQIINYSSAFVESRTLSGNEDVIEWNTSKWAAGIYVIICKYNDGSIQQLKTVKL
jgi:hypothetical protein